MRPEKQLLLDDIKEKIDGSQAIIVTTFKSFQPEISWQLSTLLAKNESQFEVVKKRVFQKAANESGFLQDLNEINGHVGVLFVTGDPIPATQQLFKFSKENNDCLEVVSGQFEKKTYSAQEVEAISKLPTKDVMRAQFLGLLEAPMAQTLSVMASLLTSVMHCLENKS